MLAPFLIVIGLALVIFFIYTTARNAKAGSGNMFQNVINSLKFGVTGSGNAGVNAKGKETAEIVYPEKIEIKEPDFIPPVSSGTPITPAPAPKGKPGKKDCSKEPNMLAQGICELMNRFS